MDTASTGRCLRQTKRRIFCPPAYVEVMNTASSIIRKPSFRLVPNGVHFYQLLALLKIRMRSYQYTNWLRLSIIMAEACGSFLSIFCPPEWQEETISASQITSLITISGWCHVASSLELFCPPDHTEDMIRRTYTSPFTTTTAAYMFMDILPSFPKYNHELLRRTKRDL